MITNKEKQEFFNSLQDGDWVTFAHEADFIFIVQFSRLGYDGFTVRWGLPSKNSKRFAYGKLSYGNLYTALSSNFYILRKSTPQELRMVGEGKVMFHELEE